MWFILSHPLAGATKYLPFYPLWSPRNKVKLFETKIFWLFHYAYINKNNKNICFSYFSNKGITQSLLNANEVKKEVPWKVLLTRNTTLPPVSQSFTLNKNNNNEIQGKNPTTLFKIEESLYRAQDEFYCLSFCYRNWSETRVEVSLENIFCWNTIVNGFWSNCQDIHSHALSLSQDTDTPPSKLSVCVRKE